MASLYLHIPFCQTKCHYCSFLSYAGMQHFHGRYIEALKTEISELAMRGDVQPLSTVFFGGGTPSILGSGPLISVLNHVRETLGIVAAAEVSIEANPGTVSYGDFSNLYNAGINRVSLGIQSFQAEDLKRLGRSHTPAAALQAVINAQKAGFENISIDLMYGLAGQTRKSWQGNLETAISLLPQHLSLYQLTIEEGTPYEELLTQGVLDLPDEDEVLAMDETTLSLCAAAGLEQYEISNFALAKRQCRHNINYWQNNDYLAVGAGAVSNYRGKREIRIAALQAYCTAVEAGVAPIAEAEELPREASFRESVVVGLRMKKGVAVERLFERYGLDVQCYYGEILDNLLSMALVELTGTHLRLTAKGRLLANWVMAELV